MSQSITCFMLDNAYTRALRGVLPTPAGGKEKLVFQALMVFCMVTCMVTLNWLLHTAHPTLSAYTQILYEYPLTFAIALCVRTFVANPLVGRIVQGTVSSTLAGFKRTLVMTLINVGVMVTIMSFFGVLISHGIFAFTLLSYIESLPISFVMALIVNLLFIGPFVKIVYTRFVKSGLTWLRSKTNKRSATASLDLLP